MKREQLFRVLELQAQARMLTVKSRLLVPELAVRRGRLRLLVLGMLLAPPSSPVVQMRAFDALPHGWNLLAAL